MKKGKDEIKDRIEGTKFHTLHVPCGKYLEISLQIYLVILSIQKESLQASPSSKSLTIQGVLSNIHDRLQGDR